MSKNGFQGFELVEGRRANICQGQGTAGSGGRAGELPSGGGVRPAAPGRFQRGTGTAGPPGAAGRAGPGGAGREQAGTRQGATGVRGRGQRGAGSYLLQGEGGAVAALLPAQEPVVEVAGRVTSEGGRACGRRAALGAAEQQPPPCPGAGAKGPGAGATPAGPAARSRSGAGGNGRGALPYRRGARSPQQLGRLGGPAGTWEPCRPELTRQPVRGSPPREKGLFRTFVF